MVATTPVAAPEGVLAVVVTAGVTEYLPDTLAALGSQRRPADAVLVIDVSGDPSEVEAAVERANLAGATVVTVAAANLGSAVAAGLDHTRAACRWLWLLHDDSIPDDDALGALLDSVAQSRSIAIAGCKQRRLDDTAALIEVGVTTTRFGRRIVDVPPGTIDQGQCDDREDVLAVGTAGMLVSSEAWRLTGGIDPALGPFGDGLEFCRRVRLAGFRVVVVPAAIVFHGRAALMGLRGRRKDRGPNPARSAAARRRSFLYTQFVGCPLPLLPVLIVFSIAAGLGRAIWRLAAKQPGLALAEVAAPFAVLARPARLAAGRARNRRVARLSRRSLRPLQADRAQTAMLRRAERLALSGRGEEQLDDLELAHRATVRRRRRITLLLLTLALAALSAIVLGRFATVTGLHGGALLPLDSSLPELWRRATASWQTSGLGTPGSGDPFWFVLAFASLLTLGHPQVAVVAIVVGAPLVAGLAAYAAAGAATRSLPVRVWAAIMWVAAPSLWFAIGQGRLGAIVAHMLLPFALLALARGVGVNRVDDFRIAVPAPVVGQARSRRAAQASRRERRAEPDRGPAFGPGSIAAAAAAGLLFAVVTASAPALAGPILVLCLLTAIAARRRRLRVALAAAGPILALAPLLLAVIRPSSPADWRVLIADPSLPTFSPHADAWWRLLGWPQAPTSAVPTALAIAFGVVLLVGAIGALVRVGAPGWGIRIAWLEAVVALGAAAWLTVQVTGLDQEAGLAVGPWAGSLVSLLVAALIAAAASGADAMIGRTAEHSFGWRQPAAIAALVIAIGVPLATLAVEAADARDHTTLAGRAGTTVPVIATDTAAGTDATSTILVSPTSKQLDWQVVRGQGPQLTDFTAIGSVRLTRGPRDASPADDPAAAAISQSIAQLALRGQGDAVRALADSAIGFIVVPAPANPADAAATEDLAATFNATAGLIAVNQDATGQTWRVAPSATDAGQRPARARILTDKGGSLAVVPAGPDGIETRVAAKGAGLTLLLAERADPGWRATLNGRELPATTTGWEQSFELPANPTGTIVVEHERRSGTLVLWGQGVVLVVLVLLSIPISRRYRARSEEV